MSKLKVKITKEKLKIPVIFTLLLVSFFLGYYFQFILETSIIFSHFFYIPIIFACLWWKGKGLVVPISLAGFLIFSPIFLGLSIYSKNFIDNLFRAIFLMSIGITVAILSENISKVENNLKERIKKLNCLYQIIGLIKNPNMPVVEILMETLEQIKYAWQFPDITCSRIVFDGKEFTTSNYKKTPWNLSTNDLIKDKELSISVHYLEKKSFLEEEKKLLKKIAEQLKAIFEFKLIR